jgi:CheY-like chemotaxis protein
MDITIIDNEVYLAQSISAKLADFGHECSVVATLNEVDKDTEVILISTNVSGNLNAFLEQHAGKIIILMVTYVSDDTVTKPIAAGATDYIIKPFMIEELMRKIDHYKSVLDLRNQNDFFTKYLDDKFKKCDLEIDTKLSFPLILVGSQKQTDAYVYRYIKQTKKHVLFVSLEDEDALQTIKKNKEAVIYATSIQKLKKSDADAVLRLANERNLIIATNNELDSDITSLKLGSSQDSFDSEEILTLDDYVKYILNTYQDRFPDTELSKKLGISRKSLWERRKKYDIYKQK